MTRFSATAQERKWGVKLDGSRFKRSAMWHNVVWIGGAWIVSAIGAWLVCRARGYTVAAWVAPLTISAFFSVSISGSTTARRENSDYLLYTPRTGHIWRTTRVGRRKRACALAVCVQEIARSRGEISTTPIKPFAAGKSGARRPDMPRQAQNDAIALPLRA